ncbi:unnamed protein product [Camellia sinensis]
MSVPTLALTFNPTFKTHHESPLSSSSSSSSRLVPKPDPSQIGFFLSSRDSWLHVLKQIAAGDLKCPLKSDFIKLVFTFDKLQTSNFYFFKIRLTNPNLLTPFFDNCVPNLEISMNVPSEMHNIVSKSNRRDYLSAALNLLCETEESDEFAQFGYENGIRAVLSVLLATLAGFGGAMSGTVILLETLKLRRWWQAWLNQQPSSEEVLCYNCGVVKICD